MTETEESDFANLQKQLTYWHDEAEKFGEIIRKISTWAQHQHERTILNENGYHSLRITGPPCDCLGCREKRTVLRLIAANL